MRCEIGLFSIVGIVFLVNAELPQKDFSIRPSVSFEANGLNCISQADIGVDGFVIDTPGTYLFTQNLNWNPAKADKTFLPPAAITITCANVTVDLNGYSLQQEGDISIGMGIKIASPANMILDTITIKSGAVRNMASLGIYADGVQNLLLQDLVVMDNGTGGAFSNGQIPPFVGGIAITGFNVNETNSRGITISNSRVVHNGGCPDVPTYGIMLNSVVDISIKNSQFNNNISPSQGAAGLYTINSNMIQVKESEANNNCGANFAIGFFVDNSLYGNGVIAIDHCIALQNVLEGTPNPSKEQTMLFADGFYLRGLGKHSNIAHCSANNQISKLRGFTPLATSLNGFELEACFDVFLDNCTALDNGGFTVTNNVARGFHIGGDRNTLKNCYTEGNLGQRSTYSYDIANFNNLGLNLSQGVPYQIVFLNCKSQIGLKTSKFQKAQ